MLWGKGGSVKNQTTKELLLTFMKTQDEFNKSIMNELKEIKTDIRDMKSTPTMMKELSKS